MMSTTGSGRPAAEHKLKKSSLDKDLSKIARIEDATRAVSLNIVALSGGILFLAAAGLIARLAGARLETTTGAGGRTAVVCGPRHGFEELLSAVRTAGLVRE